MKFLTIILTFISTLQLTAQSLNGTWLFSNNEYFLIVNDSVTRSESFDYIQGHTITGDTLTLHHIYNRNENCFTYENGVSIKIDCPDNSIPDSKFLITKLAPDSLFLEPLNRSGIAISARLKIRHFEQSRKIVENLDYEPDYYKTIKLFNSRTLYDTIDWDTILISHTTAGWWGTYYYDIQIRKDGMLTAMYHYKPYEDGKPNSDQKTETIYFEDKLSTDEQDTIQSYLNQSGLFHTEIKHKGWSSHGRLIRIRLVNEKGEKTLEAFEYLFPELLKPLVKYIADFERKNDVKRTNKAIAIPTSFLNDKN